MNRSQKSAADKPGDREIVVSVDRRLLYVLGLVAAFVIAVGAGMFVTSRRAATQGSVPAVAPAGDVAADAGALPDLRIDEASARATAEALGLGTVNIVDNSVERVVTTPDPAVAADDPGAGFGGTVTPESVFDIPQDPTSQAMIAERYKTGEVLSNLNDPNVMNTDYAPLRLETVSKPLDGPRLAISDLSLTNTYNFGVLAMDEKRAHAFTAKNVGTEDLIISRVYTGCGCTATTIGEQVIPPDGVLPAPLTLGPNESIDFSVEYDAARENRAGAVAKYIQIFTNDPTNLRFDDNDPLTHETRFRIVVEPQWFTSGTATAAP